MLLHHPDPQFYGNHVTLYFKGFDEFCKLVDTVEIDAGDTTFVTKLVGRMGMKYEVESDHRDAFCDEMNSYLRSLEFIHLGIKRYYPDGCIVLHTSNESVITLILEVKNEVGKGSGDSLMEAVGYYFHYNEHKRLLPCFLVELVGPHIGIYGVVTVSGKIQIDKLSSTHWLCFQSKDWVAMLQIAKMFKALQTVIQGDYFGVSRPCHFPLSFGHNITFKEEIKWHTFKAEYDDDKDVIVKFVESYVKVVHEFCAGENIAPKLFIYEQATTRFKIVVMEEVQNSKLLYHCICGKQDAKNLYKDKCSEVLKKMHDKGYCHGDFHSNNLLVVEETDGAKLYIIDFDWDSEVGVAKYP